MNKRQVAGFLNVLLKPLGIGISPASRTSGACFEPKHDPSSSYMNDSRLRKILVDELVEVSRSFFSEHLSDLAGSDFDLDSEVDRFFTLYSSRPFHDNTGGSGFHNAFWLFLFVRALNPQLIVESGVLKGHTSWLFEQACPGATILGFDIDLSNLQHRAGRIQFHEHDWSRYRFDSVDPGKSLVFFDCHVNHARRILEAHERGFRHILFDDDPPAHKLYGYGLPGFPTASMVCGGPPPEGSELSWCWQGKEISYRFDRQEWAEAAKVVKMHALFPDVGSLTRYGGFSFLSYVRLQEAQGRPGRVG
jgi:hypothetical protein